jgi:hypothetical protein
MYPPLHPDDGVVISGSLRIDPPLRPDEMDRLRAIASSSLRASLDDKPSTLVDELAPGHPEGPSPWVCCPDGCCLDLWDNAYVRIDALEPWLTYLVATMLADHAFDGALMIWDCATRTFSALVVEGTRVRRRPVLQRRTGDRRSARSRGGTGLRAI